MECPAFGVCNKADSCWDGRGESAYCWKIVWIQLAIGVVLVVIGDTCLVRIGPVEKLIARLFSKDIRDDADKTNDADGAKMRSPQRHRRAETNFCKEINDTSVDIPPVDKKEKIYHVASFPPQEYLFTASSMAQCVKHVFHTQFIHSVLLSSIGWGCLCSAVATCFWLIIAWEDFCIREGFATEDTTSFLRPNSAYIEQTGTAFNQVLRSYVFLPTFMIVHVARRANSEFIAWLARLKNNQYAFEELALICGSHLQEPMDMDARKLLYNIYRFATAVHLNSLKKFASLPTQQLSTSDYADDTMGLLTKDEVAIVKAAGDSGNWVVVSWLSAAVNDYFLSDSVSDKNCNPDDLVLLIKKRINPSTTSASHLTPNLLLRCMFLLVTFLIVLIIVGFPFSLLVYAGYENTSLLLGTPCFQPCVLFGVSLFVSALRLVLMAIYIMRAPFSFEKESIRTDFVLASTEQAMFTLFRAKFKQPQHKLIKSS